ncbi:MAG: hypothetical protein HUJ61_05310, partial [Bacilli bacterium]|nr:hypothetical protein [Bacilli bacterium]
MMSNPFPAPPPYGYFPPNFQNRNNNNNFLNEICDRVQKNIYKDLFGVDYEDNENERRGLKQFKINNYYPFPYIYPQNFPPYFITPMGFQPPFFANFPNNRRYNDYYGRDRRRSEESYLDNSYRRHKNRRHHNNSRYERSSNV